MSCKGPNYKSHTSKRDRTRRHKTYPASDITPQDFVKIYEDKTHKRCTGCRQVRRLELFYDDQLISKYGKLCKICKGPNYKSHKARVDKNYKRCSKCNQVKPRLEFYDAGLKSKYGLMCNTCKGPGYIERREKYKSYWANRSK